MPAAHLPTRLRRRRSVVASSQDVRSILSGRGVRLMSPYPVSREGWPAIFLNPAEFAAADKAGLVDREPDRVVLRHPYFTAIIHIQGLTPCR